MLTMVHVMAGGDFYFDGEDPTNYLFKWYMFQTYRTPGGWLVAHISKYVHPGFSENNDPSWGLHIFSNKGWWKTAKLVKYGL